MCGRFALFTAPTDIMSRFKFIDELGEYNPHFNVSPGTGIPLLTQNGDKLILTAKLWGLIPFWAKDPSLGQKLINARSETLSEKPSFKHSFRYRRCLIPANGFYEWKNGKPHYIQMKDESPIYLAGIHDSWHSPDGTQLDTCVILTTDANELLSQVHHRMPVIINDKDADFWLSRDYDQNELTKLITPTPSELFRFDKVTSPSEEILSL